MVRQANPDATGVHSAWCFAVCQPRQERRGAVVARVPHLCGPRPHRKCASISPKTAGSPQDGLPGRAGIHAGLLVVPGRGLPTLGGRAWHDLPLVAAPLGRLMGEPGLAWAERHQGAPRAGPGVACGFMGYFSAGHTLP